MGSAWITGGGVGTLGLSTARACEFREDKRIVAPAVVATKGRFFMFSELGLLGFWFLFKM